MDDQGPDITLELDRLGTVEAPRGPLPEAWRLLLQALVAAPDHQAWEAARVAVVNAAGRTLGDAVDGVLTRDYGRPFSWGERPGVAPRPAILLTALRLLADTEPAYRARAAGVGEWPSLAAWQADDPARDSTEVDFGVHWSPPGSVWPRWRVSWVGYTTEIIAVELTGEGRVQLLGFAADRQELEGRMDGWTDRCGPGGLGWVADRLDDTLTAAREEGL